MAHVHAQDIPQNVFHPHILIWHVQLLLLDCLNLKLEYMAKNSRISTFGNKGPRPNRLLGG